MYQLYQKDQDQIRDASYISDVVLVWFSMLSVFSFQFLWNFSYVSQESTSESENIKIGIFFPILRMKHLFTKNAKVREWKFCDLLAFSGKLFAGMLKKSHFASKKLNVAKILKYASRGKNSGHDSVKKTS